MNHDTWLEQDERGDLTAKLWMFLLRQGGRWLSADVAREVRVSSTVVAQLLAGMHRNGNVRQFPVIGKKRRFTYGVTGTCKIPRRVRLQEVADCVLAQPEGETA